MKLSLRVLGVLLALGLSTASLRAQEPEPEPPMPLPAGVTLREIERDGHALWLYLPADAPSALILIPPAGGTLLTAPGLGPGDRPEHVPYAKAGFAVVAFELSGVLSGRVTRDQVRAAMAQFATAHAGVADARRALDVALEEVPGLAGKPIFAAGHSSAANLVLALAAEEPRIRGAIAYAPVADAELFLVGNPLVQVAQEVPGALDRVRELSPLTLADVLDSPLMLFHAEDDDVAPIAGTRALAKKLTSRGRAPRLVTVAKGGHYDAMLSEGLPAGIEWLGERLAATK
jgi:dipeptidyl aminopeptidase/acylaminoacyl peptidase